MLAGQEFSAPALCQAIRRRGNTYSRDFRPDRKQPAIPAKAAARIGNGPTESAVPAKPRFSSNCTSLKQNTTCVTRRLWYDLRYSHNHSLVRTPCWLKHSRRIKRRPARI